MLNEGQYFGKENRYFLIKELGRGAFSEVWLADDKKSGVKVALKVYAAKTDRGLEMFKKEFESVHDMNHTNLLRPDYFDSFEDKPFLVIKYCKNGSTFNRYILQGLRIPEDECWHMLHDVAAGLNYLHKRMPPVLHQDIKPDNILIGDYGNYLITDFGISEAAIDRETIGTRGRNTKEQIAGTTAYMAPERFSKRPKAIMASDIWSLGAMMVELMTGEPPFGNFGGLTQKPDTPILEINGNYSSKLCELIRQCLEFEPKNRPGADMIEDATYKEMHGIPWELRAVHHSTTSFSDEQNHSSEQESISVPKPTPVSPRLIPQPKIVYDDGRFRSDQSKNNEKKPYDNGNSKASSKKLIYGIVAAIVILALFIGVVLALNGDDDPLPAEHQSETMDMTAAKLDSIAREKLALAKEYAAKAEEYSKKYSDQLINSENGKVEIYYTNIIDKYNEYYQQAKAYPSLTSNDPALGEQLSDMAQEARKQLYTIYNMLLHDINDLKGIGSNESAARYQKRADFVMPYISEMLDNGK